MKRLKVNNFSKLEGQRILVDGQYWMILSATEETDYLGLLQFVGRDDMVLIENEIQTSMPGEEPYVRFTYVSRGPHTWKSELLLSELRNMNTTLTSIAHRITDIRNGW
jgi:hypothetical protein